MTVQGSRSENNDNDIKIREIRMTQSFKAGLNRRSFLASTGAFGVASMAYPSMAVSQDGSVLTIRSYSDLQILDPAFRLSLPEDDIIRAIYPPLVEPVSSDTWDWKMVAAASIEQLDDLTIAFTLKDNMGFTDGYGEVTADDVKFSIERMADPANESPYAGDWAALKEVEVKDKLSGLIHLKNKFVPLWTTTLPTPASCILSRKAVEEIGGKIETTPVAQSGQVPVARMGAETAHDSQAQPGLEARAGRVRRNPHHPDRRSGDRRARL